ncbi:MAG: DUF6664 family protein [Oscillospiraceae bacterium]|jgi:hypothetical protein
MAERMVYPEWLEADEDVLAEEISQLEFELYDSNEDFKAMRDERHKLLNGSPALNAVFDNGEPKALTAQEVESLIRIFDLDNRMRNITDQAIFLYGRKNAYQFMRSMGMC